MTDEILVRAEHISKYFKVSGGRMLHAVEDVSLSIRRGETLLKQVRDSVVISDNLLTAVIGVKDLVVIEDRGVLLICPRRRVEEIGAFVGELPPQYEKYR